MRLLLLLLLTGCSVQPLTEAERFEREYKLEQTFREWKACREVYSRAGVVWVSSFQWDERRERAGRRPLSLDMRYDMARHHCSRVLREVGYK